MSNGLFWFRRDLRLEDNNGLYHCLQDNENTYLVFIFDDNIISKLDQEDRRIRFIIESLQDINNKLQQYNTQLIIQYGEPTQIITDLAQQLNISSVYSNEDYEPYAIARDMHASNSLATINIKFHQYKDQLIFAKREILSAKETPYSVFTPYKNTWNKLLSSVSLTNYPSKELLHKIKYQDQFNTDILHKLSTKFHNQSKLKGGSSAAQARLNNFIDNLDNYNNTRDIPSLDATSYLGSDLRFGTISIRNLVSLATHRKSSGGDTWLGELIWREFFSQILYNYPHVVTKPYNNKYTNIIYPNNMEWFQRWCEGSTGVAIVDAAMRQLNQTGFMHNRLRMISAFFLIKDLLVDYRYGEAYFAKMLMDYDLASNNGNWQWCASTGCDAQPYFRVFNPYLQAQRFDNDATFIKQYIPELSNLPASIILKQPNLKLYAPQYYEPIVEHSIMSKSAIMHYKQFN